MFNRNRENIKRIDYEIGILMRMLDNSKLKEEDEKRILKRVDVLKDVRATLCGPPKDHTLLGVVLNGLFGLAGVLVILYFEKAEIITSKAWNMASRKLGG